MARTKQTYRKPVLPKLVKLAFFRQSKKVGESSWVPPGEEAFQCLMLDKLQEWQRVAEGGNSGAQRVRDAMTEAGFPLDLSRGTYEYGQPNKHRKKRDPLFKWNALTPKHRIISLLHDWREGTIYLRCKALVSDAKRTGDDVVRDRPVKKVKLSQRVLVTPLSLDIDLPGESDNNQEQEKEGES
jgi:hypothetical protein